MIAAATKQQQKTTKTIKTTLIIDYVNIALLDIFSNEFHHNH